MWTSNDFNGLHFLACAAGYADLVVGERRTVSDLRTARNAVPGARLATNLDDAIEILIDLNKQSTARAAA